MRFAEALPDGRRTVPTSMLPDGPTISLSKGVNRVEDPAYQSATTFSPEFLCAGKDIRPYRWIESNGARRCPASKTWTDNTCGNCWSGLVDVFGITVKPLTAGWIVAFGDDDCNGREPVVGALPVDVGVGADEGSGEEIKFVRRDDFGHVDRFDEWSGGKAPSRVRCDEHGRFRGPRRVVVVCVAEVRQRHADLALVCSGRSEDQGPVQVCWSIRFHQRREVIETGFRISVANHPIMLADTAHRVEQSALFRGRQRETLLCSWSDFGSDIAALWVRRSRPDLEHQPNLDEASHAGAGGPHGPTKYRREFAR